MIIAICIFMLCLSAVAAKRKPQQKRRATVKQSAKINALLHNIEVYDGTPKGQKRLEEIL